MFSRILLFLIGVGVGIYATNWFNENVPDLVNPPDSLMPAPAPSVNQQLGEADDVQQNQSLSETIRILKSIISKEAI